MLYTHSTFAVVRNLPGLTHFLHQIHPFMCTPVAFPTASAQWGTTNMFFFTLYYQGPYLPVRRLHTQCRSEYIIFFLKRKFRWEFYKCPIIYIYNFEHLCKSWIASGLNFKSSGSKLKVAKKGSCITFKFLALWSCRVINTPFSHGFKVLKGWWAGEPRSAVSATAVSAFACSLH
jgi:hypothetical protein